MKNQKRGKENLGKKVILYGRRQEAGQKEEEGARE